MTTKSAVSLDRSPKYVKVQRDVLSYAMKEGLGVGARLPSEQELAERLGASMITVRRALAELARAGIVDRVHGSGTYLKRALKKAHPTIGTVALVDVPKPATVPRPLATPGQAVIRVLGELLEQRGYALDVIHAQVPDDKTMNLLRGAVAAVLTGTLDSEWKDFVNAISIPSVILGSHRLKGRHWIARYDWETAAHDMTRRLWDAGCRRIGLVTGIEGYPPAHEIACGYRRACRAHGVAPGPEVILWSAPDTIHGEVEPFLRRSTAWRFDGLVVEPGLVPAVIGYCYACHSSAARPALGLLSVTPTYLNRAPKLFESWFRGDLASECAALLMKAIGSRLLQPETVLLPPVIEADT
ncbi:MAG: GntR family transcriptional regulator [Kiritimatiellae bacterium]|nr:GntR family transcriptional regulator [Kiritimatiellia bacterium]